MTYPTTKLDRAVDSAIAKSNRAYLAQLDAAGPGACPNCMRQGGNQCWCCTDPRVLEAAEAAMDDEGVPEDDRNRRRAELVELIETMEES